MAWSDFFPILTDEQVNEYQNSATPAEVQELKDSFSGRCLNPQRSCAHLLSFALSPALPPLSRFSSVLAPLPTQQGESGILPRMVSAVLRNACRQIAAQHPEAAVRIYLDPAWSASAEELMSMGCQVVEMSAPSEGPNPAALWRFLALEEDAAVTFVGLDDIDRIELSIERSAALRSLGLAGWRSPLDCRWNYRPIHPERFGCIRPQPIRDLLCAYIWHLRRARPQGAASLGDHFLYLRYGERQPSWESRDLPEFFLMSAIYPRLAFEGLLNLIEADDQHSRWLALDIEYATWANSSSELLFVEHSHPAHLISLMELEDSTLVGSMLMRLTMENRYPAYSEAGRGGTGRDKGVIEADD